MLTLGRPYYRPIGPEPVSSSATEMRANINETIDASVSNAGGPTAEWADRRMVDLTAVTTSLTADNAAPNPEGICDAISSRCWTACDESGFAFASLRTRRNKP
jgi:hypothetical protein